MCCCGYSKQHHTTTHFVKMCCCGYSKQHPQHHTTTHFVKMCFCGYSKQHPQHHTTTHFVKMCCCGYSKQHPQHHTTTNFVNVVVVCHLWTIVNLQHDTPKWYVVLEVFCDSSNDIVIPSGQTQYAKLLLICLYIHELICWLVCLREMNPTALVCLFYWRT